MGIGFASLRSNSLHGLKQCTLTAEHQHSRFFATEGNKKHNEQAVDRANTVRETPAAGQSQQDDLREWGDYVLNPSNDETHHEGREERRDDETHGPQVKLEAGQRVRVRTKHFNHTLRAWRWNGNRSVTMNRPVTCGHVL